MSICPNCEKTIPNSIIRCPYCNYLIDKSYRIYLRKEFNPKACNVPAKMGANFKNLVSVVLSKSVAQSWEKAIMEWEIYDCVEDISCESSCVCGKERIRYLFTIKNKLNNNCIFPIGSSCIQKFDREDLNKEASVMEGMFKLLRAIRDNNYISLSTEYFSRKLLKALYERGVFVPNEFNNFDGEKDYLFMLNMFNKKNAPTPSQQKKVRAIIVASIKPYLEKELDRKMK